MSMELSELRIRIDEVDRELVRLLERRMDVSRDIAACKAERGTPVYDPAREAEKLAAVRAMCRPDTAAGISDVFRAIMAASRSYQSELQSEMREGRNGQ